MGEQFDVVIVGGAVTGSVLALALSSLSQHKMRIAIVEKQLPNYTQQGGFDARSIALAQGSLQKFAQIRPLVGNSLAEQIQQIATPIQQIQVSDLGHFGKTTLKASELNVAQLGVVVELAKLGKILTACIERQPNIHCFCPNQITHFERSQTEVLIRLQSGEQIRTQLMVAADGVQSQIALQCGVDTELLKDYQQSALIANVEISEPHQGQAFERFTTQGPLALLPLSDNRMSLVWCVKQAEDLLSLADEDFLSQLQQQFGWKLGRFKQVSKRFVYPLTSQKAQSHIHHRLAIVGNAAQLLHPVAGQGFNLGMRDLFTLAQLLAKASAEGKDLGEFALLNQFEQSRKLDQTQIIRLTSGLVSLFSCDFLPLQAVRNLGLLAISHSKLLRENIANKALGWQ
ncbi:2-octaprenyl-6-methoxyphenyl hydroxylase [Actinobacillus genomosp. 2]|uniref:2-octaprenyl-6-methoxyphenyl hydroxylase n=1 Tax=Actinobacillus genomosp. 2 TaxID=230709 RepID=UPI0024427BCB|nr:2-octaprenyl-6-methoxyphenyl hydroxylase [Actinobacillus genomosp. 2]WGE32387.1 2-octaprenyl-6-methoxyphenyl hydroxylase [Actinobacillus genomosp. 2]